MKKEGKFNHEQHVYVDISQVYHPIHPSKEEMIPLYIALSDTCNAACGPTYPYPTFPHVSRVPRRQRHWSPKENKAMRGESGPSSWPVWEVKVTSFPSFQKWTKVQVLC